MIFLREITKDDIQYINKWRSKESIIDTLGTTFRYINYETDLNWFDNYLKNRHKEVRCAICKKEDGSIIGVVYLLQIDYQNRNAEFAIFIGNKEEQGKGYGKQASTMMLKHAFNDLNLHKVYLTVLESNTNAIKLYNKIGFTQNGILPDEVFKKGKYHNMILMSCFSRSIVE
jgi:UDP-4-amino-4,6-dideoxy-N-acetyl-beta-L-altrosamine N-acetyltransferase